MSCRRGMFVCLSMYVSIVVQAAPAHAWGPLTHPVISHRAAVEAQRPDLSEDRTFLDASNAPDMIAFETITRFQRRFEYAHNTRDADGVYRQPFGSRLYRIATAKHGGRSWPRGERLALGWLSHQLADDVVHYDNGYAKTRRLVQGAPRLPGMEIAEHAIAEFAVDCIMHRAYPTIVADVGVAANQALVHDGAVLVHNDRGFVPGVWADETQSMLTCAETHRISTNWSKAVAVAKSLVALIDRVNPDGFASMCRHFDDYDDDEPMDGGGFQSSVFRVADGLRNPITRVSVEGLNGRCHPDGTAIANVNSRTAPPSRSNAREWWRSWIPEKTSAEAAETPGIDSSQAETTPPALPYSTGGEFYYLFLKVLVDALDAFGAITVTETTSAVSTYHYEGTTYTTGVEYEYEATVTTDAPLLDAIQGISQEWKDTDRPLWERIWGRFVDAILNNPGWDFEQVSRAATDFFGPFIEITQPTDGAAIGHQVSNIVAFVDDGPFGAGVETTGAVCVLDGEELAPAIWFGPSECEWNVPVALAEGTHTVVVSAVDRCGQSTTITAEFCIDTTRPELAVDVLSKHVNRRLGTNVVFNIAANEGTVLIRIYRVLDVPRQPFGPQVGWRMFDAGSSRFEWDGTDYSGIALPNGAYRIVIDVFDRAGNTTSTRIGVQIVSK